MAISLANKRFIEEACEKEKCASFVRTFFVSGKYSGEWIKCSSTTCAIDQPPADFNKTSSVLNVDESFASAGKDPYVFCFACDRIFHVKCQELDLCSLLSSAAPYLCIDCTTNPLNEFAVGFYNSKKWICGVAARRRRMFDAETINKCPELMGEQTLCLDFEAEDILSFVNTEGVSEESLGLILALERQKLETQKAALKFVHHLETSKETMQEQEDTIEILKRELAAEKAKNTKPSAAEQTNPPRKRVSFFPESFDAESTRTAKPRNVQIKTIDSVLENLLNKSRLNHSNDSSRSAKYDSKRPYNTAVLESSLPSLNDPELTMTERMMLCATRAHLESSYVQNQVSQEMKLGVIRKNLQKITKFKGDARGWLKFKQEVNRYRELGQYEDDVMKIIVFGALEGDAEKRVKDLIDVATLEQIMEILETSFGHAPSIIKACESDILKFRLKGELMRNDAVHINTMIQTYLNSCSTAGVPTLNSNMLATHILSQLNSTHKLFFRQHYHHKRPQDTTQMPDLEIMFSFLEGLAYDLEVRVEEKEDKPQRPKPIQVNSTATNTSFSSSAANSSGNSSEQDFMFKVLDGKIAKYVGYDMSLVGMLNKKCFACESTQHFTLECSKFRAMTDAQRNSLVGNKKICKVCLLTNDHKPSDCQLKVGCGFKLSGNSRCTSRHHILFHESSMQSSSQTSQQNRSQGSFRPYRRSNTNRNSRRGQQLATNQVPNKSTQDLASSSANNSDQTPKLTGAISLANDPKNAVLYATFPRQLQTMSYNNHRTVKMFKHIVYGPTEGTYVYSIGDSAAEISLMREDLRQQLGIEGTRTTIDLQWKDDTIQTIPAIKIKLEIQSLNSEELIVLNDVYAVEEAYFSLPTRSLDVTQLKQQFPYLKEAEFDSYENAKPVLLIGTPHASCFEAIEPMLQDGEGKPVAIKTKLGWTIFGGSPEMYAKEPYAIEMTVQSPESQKVDDAESKSNDRQLNEFFAHFCSIESLGITPKSSHMTDEEKAAIEIIEQEWRVVENGAIEVPLAWRKENGKIPKLDDNFSMVYQRQLSHERKLNKNPLHLKAYNELFLSSMQEGYMREATPEDLYSKHKNVYYLPMSLVINERKIPVKYRIVYDASAKHNGKSLNDYLLKGPKLIVDMLQPVFKFRQDHIAYICDVKSMYPRIHISPRDQQVQRVLWRESSEKPMKTYIHQRMLFGPTSSPFTSQLVKNKTADKFMNEFPLASDAIKNYMYMDDGLMSAKTVKQAVQIAKDCIHILKSIDWDLVSFQSNSKEFLKALPITHVKKELVEILTCETESYATKVLGCVYDPQSDCFLYQYDNDFVKATINNGHRPTKRDQASTIARMFDVRGEVAHFIIRGRILLQRSWKAKIGWDDTISEEDFQLWIKWLESLKEIAKLKIPRQYVSHLECLAEADSLEVHVFCDAGKEAFAAAAYLVAEYKCNRHTSLIMAKAKVTPLKRKTKTEMSEMPRLELTSCLIAARMAETVIKYHHDLSIKRYCWSDSTIALSWITNPNIHLEKYAISPVEEILEKTEREDWRHVPSQLNPADIATKFQKFDFSDSQSIWFKGPKFLLQPKHLWPSQENCQHNNEIVTPLVCNISNNPKIYPSEGMSLPPVKCEFTADLLIYIPHSIKSNWMKLVRLVGRSLKLMDMVKNLKSKDKQIKLSNKVECTTERDSWFILEPVEYERATLFIARKMQMEAFKEEYHKLAKGQLVTNQDFLQLRVFMDDQGVLRINSRVALDPKVYPQRYLPFLPRNHFLTEVLLFWYHLKFNHICVEAQVAEIRSKFWIPRLKSEVAKIKRICNYCGYIRANPQPPLMSSLPDYRVNPEMKPFEVIAMDCTGEITIHRHYKPVKVYILLFTCMLTRFVHVHLLDKMDSLAILEAITIFWAAHGPVSKIVTDNGRNFVGAARRLKKDQAEAEITQQLKEKGELLKQQLAEKYNLKWEFLPPYSPWMGGVHERMIKEIKRAIELTLQKKKLSSVELNIAIHEAAHRLNCRPLTANPIEAEDKPVLTPHLLAKQRDGWPLLPSQQNYSYDPEDKKDRLIYHRGRAIADEIMSRFVKEWLPIITRRCKWFKNVEDFKVGDLVLLIDPSKTRNAWPRARVHEVYAGRNGVVRVIDVKLPNGEIIPRYSVQRAAKLDIKARSEENTEPTAKENTD